MSYVSTMPDVMQGAAQDLAGLRASLTEAAAASAGRTTGIAAAARDEVSIAIASLFDTAGKDFQALNAQAQAFQAEFESLLGTGAAGYASAELANARQVLGSALGKQVASAAASAAAVPAATYTTFDLFDGILNINIGSDGILFTIGTPKITMPGVHIPPIALGPFNLPQVQIPPIHIGAGSTPPIHVNPFFLPASIIPPIFVLAGQTPPIHVGAFRLPSIITPQIFVPGITLPSVTVPLFHSPEITIGGWSLPTITEAQINFPKIQFPDISVSGNDQDLVIIHNSNPFIPDFHIRLETFDFASSLGFTVPGFITQFSIPGPQFSQFSLPTVTISGPGGNPYVFPSVQLSGFTIPSITIPPTDVGPWTLPVLSWPTFATPPVVIPPIFVGAFNLPRITWPAFSTPPIDVLPISVGGFDLPDINIPNTTVNSIPLAQFGIPPIPTWLSNLAAQANNFVSVAQLVADSLLGLTP